MSSEGARGVLFVPAMPRLLHRVVFLATLASLAACQGPPTSSGSRVDGARVAGSRVAGPRIVERWIDEDPIRIFTEAQVRLSAEVFTWTFDGPRDLAPWSRSRDVQFLASSAAGRAVVWRPEKSPRLIRSTDFAAASVDALTLTLSGFVSGKIRLLWAGDGEVFDRRRHLDLMDHEHQPGDPSSYRFQLSSHPRWQGRITGLALDLPAVRRRRLRLARIVGWKDSVSGERLAEAAAGPWKVDLGAEVRNAFLALPRRPIVRRIEVPEGGVLRFAYGAAETLAAPVRFRLSAHLDAGPPQPLWEDVIRPPERSRVGRWHPAAVDLGELAGRSVELRLETRPERAERPPAFWASPRLVAAATAPAPPNVVLIVVDTLRADRLSLYGYERPTSPRIDDWARRRGVTFRHAVAPSPWTLPSHVSLFTGLDAIRHGLNYGRGPSALPRGSTLAEVLRQAGYATLAITGGVYLHPRYGLQQGFDRFRYWPSSRPQTEELEQGVDRALSWIDAQRQRPFFLFFHTYETHGPLTARRPFLDRLAPDLAETGMANRIKFDSLPVVAAEGFVSRKRLMLERPPPATGLEPLPDAALPVVDALYDSGVAYADHHLGRLLSRLEAADLAADTLVVLTSDHGQGLGEKGLAGHSFLYDFNLLVPLVVALPDGRGKGRTVDRQVRLIDVLPTILDHAGVTPPQGIDGASLLPLIADRRAEFPDTAWTYAASPNYGISLRVANRLKYIFNNSAATAIHGHSELYDLAADPGETVDLAAAEAARVERLRDQVTREYLDRFSGLRIDLANAGPASYTVRVNGRGFLGPSRIKATDLPGPVIVWRDGGEFDADVPAASSYSLILEGVPADGRLQLAVAGAGLAERCRGTVTAADLTTPRFMVLAPDACGTSRSVEGTAGRRIALSMVHQRIEVPPPPVLDPELERKLRALGYVE